MSPAAPSNTPPRRAPGASASSALFVVGLVAAATCGSSYFLSNPHRSPDEREYLALGRTFAEAGAMELPGGIVAKRMPLYPALIAVVCRWQGPEHFENALLAIQSVLAWGSVVMLAALTSHLAEPRAGLIAGLLAALYAPWLFLQASFLTETLLIFLLTAALWSYAHSPRTGLSALDRAASLGGSAFAGILLALGALTRVDAAVWCPVFAVHAALCDDAGRRPRATRAALLVLPSVLLLTGWGLRNRARLGEFTMNTTGGLNFHLGHCDAYRDDPGLGRANYAALDRLIAQGRSEIEADRELFQLGWRFVREYPGRTLADTARKLGVWLDSNVTPSAPTYLLVAVVAIGAALRRAGSAPVRVAAGRRAGQIAPCFAIFIATAAWLWSVRSTSRPWVHPNEVVLAGLVSLALLRGAMPMAGLVFGLLAGQLLLALAFIPLERLRWTVDGLLIAAGAIGLSRLCDRLALAGPTSRGLDPRS